MRPLATELGLLLVLLLVGAALGWLVPEQPNAQTIDLTDAVGPRRGDIAGIYNTEPSLGAAWSSGSALVQIHHGYSVAPLYRATVRLRADNPQGAQPLTFLANERTIATVLPSQAFRTYTMLLPPPATSNDALRFAFQTPTFTGAINPRELGVVLTGIAIEPLPSTNWPARVLVGALALALWRWLRRFGAPPTHALLICASYLASVLLIASLARPTPLGLPLLAALAALAAMVGAVIAPETPSRLGLTVLAVLVSCGGMLWPSWITDDAFISFRYAQNLVAGNGLVYNAGERVEGYTNFLWTMLAALALRLGGDLVWLSYTSGVVIGLALLLATYRLGRRLGPAWALAAALIVATSQSVLVYTSRGSGLETGLFALLVLAGCAFASSPQLARWCGAWFALATLTRPEGALLMGLTLLWMLGKYVTTGSRQSAVGAPPIPQPLPPAVGEGEGVLPAPLVREGPGERGGGQGRFASRALSAILPVLGWYLVIVVPYYLWRTVYYSEFLPNTFYAKTGGGLRQIVRGLGYTGAFAWTLGGPLALLAYAALAGGLRAAMRQWQGYVILIITVYTLYIIVVGGDHFPGDRFFVPIVPLIALCMADGLARVDRWLRQSRSLRILAPPAIAAALLICAAGGLFRGNNFETVIVGDNESVWIWRELGWWLRDHGPPGASMAALGAGAVAYYSDRPIVDLLGLTDKHIARVSSDTIGSGTAGHEKRDPAYVLDVRRPTYIPQMWEEYFASGPSLRNRYILVTMQTRYGRELRLWQRMR